MEINFKKNYEVEFVISEAEQKAFEIWKEYYEECEAFDRRVCSGNRNGSAIPVTPEEHKLMIQNCYAQRDRALKLLEKIGLNWQTSRTIRLRALGEVRP